MPTIRVFALLLLTLRLSCPLFAQTAEIRQERTPYNFQSAAGVPISNVPNSPPGSDGRAPDPAIEGTPTFFQFQNFFSFGGIAAPLAPLALNEALSYSSNASSIQIPFAKDSDGNVTVVLKSAQVGSAFLSRQISFLFGSIIRVPDTDVDGHLLTGGGTYWNAEPFTTNSHQNASYYWSPNLRAVFAVQAGPIAITWKTLTPETSVPAGVQDVDWVSQSGFYYRLFTASYTVSSSPVKSPRKMFWTQGSFQHIGKPVSVPAARIGAVKVVYNNNFLERVDHEYISPGQVPIVETNRLEETRTLWYDQQQGQIFAFNVEGRVFVELLGDSREDGQSRRHLGFEIVDVFRQPIPDDVIVNLGERLNSWQDGRDDTALFPEPVLQVGAPTFIYQHAVTGGDRSEFFATRETHNQNDVLVHWLEKGEVGLHWPFRLVRYQQVWPSDVSKYSHYIRPLVATEAEALETAVPLPLNNAPVIEYQDPLDQPRAKLSGLNFYTFLDIANPVHRTLLRFNSGDQLAFERVFSWLEVNLKNGSFSATLATNLSAWDPSSSTLTFPNQLTAPRVVNAAAIVGERINPPEGELGANGGVEYWAGHIVLDKGTSFDVNAYIDPFAQGFVTANRGAIIPVNAIPGKNGLEIQWFRKNAADLGRGFQTIYWPAVIANYTISWPSAGSEIVLASNDGSGGLVSLQAKGRIYYQNDPQLPGYNPNEEHALMLAGQAYALRDDLNAISGADYSSEPYVLLEYVEADNRPAIRAFHVLREKPQDGIVFDYVTEAGQKLQAPMPLPLLPKPVEGSGPSAINYNSEPLAPNGDFPVNWSNAVNAGGPYQHYRKFVYRDRKEDFWVYRGTHAGPPELAAGSYNVGTKTFDPLPNAVAVVGQDFNYNINSSRVAGSLLVQARADTPLPVWLRTDGVNLVGRPAPTDVGTSTYFLVITSVDDQSSVTNSLQITVGSSGNVVVQAPLEITSFSTYANGNVTYFDRPPFLASSPVETNSFTMRFYYKTQDGFAWPGVANPPEVGAIVPYLRPKNGGGGFVGDPTAKSTAALSIVYRPIWPYSEERLGKMRLGDTLSTPKNGLPAVRGQTSMKVLYQQSIARDITAANASAILHDATREKEYDISLQGLERLPAGIRTDSYQGKQYFPSLPPYLVKRLFFDPNRGTKGHLVLKGEYVSEPVGISYVLLNVLRGSELATVQNLCPAGDADLAKWIASVNGLSTKLETFREDPEVPGTFIPEPSLDHTVDVGALAEVNDDDSAVDSYALSASGPGQGYITLIAGNGFAFTPPAEPVSMYIVKVGAPLFKGELKVIASDNPLNEQLTMQHSADLAGRFSEYEYQWKIAPPVDGSNPPITPGMEAWTDLVSGTDIPRFTLGGAGIQALSDNWLVMRYRPINPAHPLYNQWSDWTDPQLAEGWIKRVLAGINPFTQRVKDLFNNRVNTDVSILTQAGHRWEGDVALNLANINNFGLIEIYETVLRRGKQLSIDAGINYGPANDALLLAAGYLNDLYMMIGNDAWADAANPTIGIGTSDPAYGDISTALFAFKGQEPSLLEEELALLRGRDDFLQPGVRVPPVYNRLFWNYTRGIDSGEVIYALNYNIREDNDIGVDGIIDAKDAAKLFPQGHGDAYGQYLTALKGYYSLLIDPNFDWVPRSEAVLVLGKPVQVDYLDERKFAAAAGAVARAGRQIFDLTWRRDYSPGHNGWESFSQSRTNSSFAPPTVHNWGMDHWAARTSQGAYINWVTGNAILPDRDPDPSHDGIQKVDRTTVPELGELAALADGLQTDMDNAEGNLSPLGLPDGSIAFDINPSKVVGTDPSTHFEQIYERAKLALNNAVASFDDAKGVTALMRSQQDSLVAYQAQVALQEKSYQNALIELYGTPYPDDIGPGRTYAQDYEGPDLIHYTYVDLPEIEFPELWNHTEATTFRIDIQDLPSDWATTLYTDFNFVKKADTSDYDPTNYVTFNLGPNGFADKPENWVSKRTSPGSIQQAISALIMAHNKLRQSAFDETRGESDLDKAIRLFESKKNTLELIKKTEASNFELEDDIENLRSTYEVLSKDLETSIEVADLVKDVALEDVPESSIFGLAFGGDTFFFARAVIAGVYFAAKLSLLAADAGSFRVVTGEIKDKRETILEQTKQIADLQLQQELREGVEQLFERMETIQADLETINFRLRDLDDADRKLRSLKAQGNRIQAEREVFRKRTAAVVQGYRTRDAAYQIFRSEKLERYKTLFDLSARYAYLAANAYDYETGLLNTDEGKAFINRIVRSRALGVVRNGEPQFAGSDTGDPGLSSALAEMKADWDVLKGRLGFNNADSYGTTVSLRTEQSRILPGSDGDAAWQDMLQRSRKANLLDDSDVSRFCMQISSGDGLPVPGIVMEFSTVIADGVNLFGQNLAPTDHAFSASSFATKIYAVGVAFEGYQGMDNPTANTSGVTGTGSTSPTDSSLDFLDPKALSATPYIYLIPVGVDSMRSPPLGDASAIRSWQVDDVTVPLPFNIGASGFSTRKLWESNDSLTEELFSFRKHQAFRPVSTTDAFALDIYGATGQLAPSQFTNRRLIGRSVWNSKWKLVIPGRTLLNDPNEGLDRFIQTVKDMKLHFITYSYSGN